MKMKHIFFGGGVKICGTFSRYGPDLNCCQISSTRAAAMGWAAPALITLNCGYFLPLSLAYGTSKAGAEVLLFFSPPHVLLPPSLLLSCSLSLLIFSSSSFSEEKWKMLLFFWQRCQNSEQGLGSASLFMKPRRGPERRAPNCRLTIWSTWSQSADSDCCWPIVEGSGHLQSIVLHVAG